MSARDGTLLRLLFGARAWRLAIFRQRLMNSQFFI
jgi:hypothetical protein